MCTKEWKRQTGERGRVEWKNRYNPRSVEIVLRFCLNFSSLLCLKRSAKSNGLQLITSVNNDEAALVQTMWVRRSECRSNCSRYENVFTSIISLVTQKQYQEQPQSATLWQWVVNGAALWPKWAPTLVSILQGGRWEGVGKLLRQWANYDKWLQVVVVADRARDTEDDKDTTTTPVLG